MPVEYTREQMEQVWSWVHNEDRCVTVQTIALEIGLPRPVASKMMKDLPLFKSPKEGKKVAYDITYCLLTGESETACKVTVVKFVKKRTQIPSDNDNEMKEGDSGTIYSIAVVDTESLESAHERDMANFREKLMSETSSILSPRLHCHAVKPNQDIQLSSADPVKEHRMPEAEETQTLPLKRAPKPTAARKLTTAKDFFGKASKNQTKKKVETASNGKTDNKATTDGKKKDGRIKDKNAAGTRRTQNKKSVKIYSAESEDDDDDDKTVEYIEPQSQPKRRRTSQEEKENTVNSVPQTKSRVGNADDFVGDEDEDEDFLKEDELRKQRNNTREREEAKREKDRAKQLEAAALRQRSVEKASTDEAAPKQERTRKRRKTLQNKTTVDENGYLVSETVTVWEDVPSDEEQDKKQSGSFAKTTKGALKPKKNMKQAGLMGFFKAK